MAAALERQYAKEFYTNPWSKSFCFYIGPELRFQTSSGSIPAIQAVDVSWQTRWSSVSKFLTLFLNNNLTYGLIRNYNRIFLKIGCDFKSFEKYSVFQFQTAQATLVGLRVTIQNSVDPTSYPQADMNEECKNWFLETLLHSAPFQLIAISLMF